MIHGHLFASSCHNPDRKPPQLSGSRDPSANEVDGWGPYDSSHPQNAFGYAVIKRILDYARVDYRVPEAKPFACLEQRTDPRHCFAHPSVARPGILYPPLPCLFL